MAEGDNIYIFDPNRANAVDEFRRRRRELEDLFRERLRYESSGMRILRTPKFADFGPGSMLPVDQTKPVDLTLPAVTRNAAHYILGADPAGPDLSYATYSTMYEMAPPSHAEMRWAVQSSERPVAVAEPPIPDAIPMPSRDMLKRQALELRTVDDVLGDLAVRAEKCLGYGVLRKRMKLQSPLLAVLHELEIEPYDGESVAAYKREMLAYARIEAQRMDAAEKQPYWNRRVAAWARFRIDQYRKPIPEFALEKALQIHDACPNVQFEIEELEVVQDPFLIAKLGNVRLYIEVWGEPKFERVL